MGTRNTKLFLLKTHRRSARIAMADDPRVDTLNVIFTNRRSPYKPKVILKTTKDILKTKGHFSIN